MRLNYYITNAYTGLVKDDLLNCVDYTHKKIEGLIMNKGNIEKNKY